MTQFQRHDTVKKICNKSAASYSLHVHCLGLCESAMSTLCIRAWPFYWGVHKWGYMLNKSVDDLNANAEPSIHFLPMSFVPSWLHMARIYSSLASLHLSNNDRTCPRAPSRMLTLKHGSTKLPLLGLAGSCFTALCYLQVLELRTHAFAIQAWPGLEGFEAFGQQLGASTLHLNLAMSIIGEPTFPAHGIKVKRMMCEAVVCAINRGTRA